MFVMSLGLFLLARMYNRHRELQDSVGLLQCVLLLETNIPLYVKFERRKNSAN